MPLLKFQPSYLGNSKFIAGVLISP